MRYFKAKKGLFQLRYIYGKLRYPVHFVLTGFFCKSFIYKVLKVFFGVVYVHFIMLLLFYRLFCKLIFIHFFCPSKILFACPVGQNYPQKAIAQKHICYQPIPCLSSHTKPCRANALCKPLPA